MSKNSPPSNRMSRNIKRKKNMLVSSIKWIFVAALAGFFLTFILSILHAFKNGIASALTDVFNQYFSLLAEIENRSPTFARLITDSQMLIQTKTLNGLHYTESLTPFTLPDLSHITLWNEAQYYLNAFSLLALWSLKLDLLKFISVISSFMLFIFFGILGFLDGYLSRYVRTAEGARESTYTYHHLTSYTFRLPYCLMVAYIALPVGLDPLLMVTCLALLVFMFCRMSASNLKKFI